MKKVNKRFSLNQSGVVLTMVMIVLLVMSIIISGVVFITVSNLDNSKKAASHTETYYVAEGGINYLVQSFELYYPTAPTTSADAFFSAIDSYAAGFPISNKQTLSFTENKGMTSQALIWVVPMEVTSSDTHQYTLYSMGFIGNISRTLSKTVSIKYVDGGVSFKNAVFSVGVINVGGAVIDGTIQTNSTEEPSITFRGGSVLQIYIPDGTTPKDIVSSNNYDESIIGDASMNMESGTNGIINVNSPTVNLIDDEKFVAPPTEGKLKYKSFTSAGKTYVLVNDSGNLQITATNNLTVPTIYNIGNENPGKSVFYVPNFKISEYAENFTLEVNRNITIVTDTLWLNNQFKVTGEGNLTIYVKPYKSGNSSNTRIQISASGDVGHQTDSKKMTIYVGDLTYKSGGKNIPVLLSMGSGAYNFNLICSNLNIDLNDSRQNGLIATNAEVKDAIKISNITANVFIGPSSTSSAILLYVPSGLVAMKSASSRFYGAIVAEQFVSDTGNSSPKIFYRTVNNYLPDGLIDLDEFKTDPTITIVKTPTTE